ncbi:CmpA/NrtA family ABC transporter substrate-binding protein [Thiomonas sp.]
MSVHDDPFNPYVRLGGCCCCGRHATQAAHDADGDADGQIDATDAQQLSRRAIETAVMRAIFPNDGERRRFLRAVGRNTALAALSQLVPFGALEAMAQETNGALEKKDLKVGFIPITCATPLIMADPLGFYAKEGLNVQLMKTAGWALIRDKVINGEYDASHMLAPMPIAISMGVGSNAMPVNVMTIQNINGQAIVLALKHKTNRDPKNWKGFKFAIPFDYSIHNMLLRYYLAQAGLDPDRDVQLRVVPPPDMVANLRAGNIDGFLGPDPINQRAVYDEVGFIHLLSMEIWNGHPCCSFSVPTKFIQQNPNTFAALYRAILKASAMAHEHKNRPLIAKAIAPAKYLNQPEIVVQQALTGTFADGLGNVRTVPDRVDFQPFPWYSMAMWILTQMQRWGYVKGAVNYKGIAEQVYLLTDARKHMQQLGMNPPATDMRSYVVMGKTFDPAKATAYVNSFPIRHTA